MDRSYRNRLFIPLSETIQDAATNSNFKLSNLLFDGGKNAEPPKNEVDAAARHYAIHGSFPTKFQQKLDASRQLLQQRKEQQQAADKGEEKEEGNEGVVKEETTMPSIYSAHLYRPFGLQEGGNGKCNCGKPNCPVCGKGKTSKLGMTEAEGNATGISQGTGLGNPQSTANHLYQIPINQYQDSDGSFIGDGDSAETLRTNIPALLAARNAGGQPHPLTVSNGINKRSGSGGFKLKPLRDDLGPNG